MISFVHFELAPTRLSIVEEFLGPQNKTFNHQLGLEQGNKTWNKCNTLRSEQNHSIRVIYTLEITGKFLFPGAKHRQRNNSVAPGNVGTVPRAGPPPVPSTAPCAHQAHTALAQNHF